MGSGPKLKLRHRVESITDGGEMSYDSSVRLVGAYRSDCRDSSGTAQAGTYAGSVEASHGDSGAVRCVLIRLYREFDPGSGRTLAACLTHASRTGRI